MKTVLKRCAAIMVSLIIFSGTADAANITRWDGYVGLMTENSTDTIVDMNKLGVISAAGLTPSSRIKGGAMFTGRWGEHLSKGTLTFNGVPRDWSSYEKVIIPIYSEVPTGAKVTIVLSCDYEPSPGTQSSYWHYAFNINWTGWKTFELNFGDDFQQYNNANLKKVQRLSFNATGWSAVPHADSVLFFDSITAKVGEADAALVTGYSVTQRNAFFKAIEGGAAMYDFSRFAFSEGESVEIDPENLAAYPVTADGITMAPISFFENILGGAVSDGAEGTVIALEGKSIEVIAGQKEYTAGGEPKEFTVPPYTHGGILYVPAIECAEALGKSAATFSGLTVIGTSANIKAMEDDPLLGEIGAYMTANRGLNPDDISKEDFDLVKENWLKHLVGDEESDLENEIVAATIKSVNSSAQSAWDAMNKSPDATVLFGNSPIVESEHMTSQYSYLNRMAKGYGTYGAELYKNKALKADIMYATQWLYEHLYGEAEITNTGWRNTGAFNWWDWYVGVPGHLTETLLIMEPDMTQAGINKYLAPFKHFMKIMRNRKNLTDAQSRIHVVTLAAILEQNVELMQECLEDFDMVLQIVPTGDGVHEDFMYTNHTYYPYTGGYGTDVLLSRLVRVASILAGTKFEITSAQKYNQALWMYNTFEPVMYKGSVMSMLSGRNPHNGIGLGRTVVQAALDLLGCFGPEDDLKLKMLIKRHVTEDNLQNVINGLRLNSKIALLEVFEDDSLPDPEPIIEARVYYTGDRVVQHREGYSVGVALSSSRMANYESINGANKTAWYTGDGMLYIYNYPNNKEDQFGSSFWGNANPYHMPGTTVDTQVREAVSIGSFYLPTPNFVGGVEFENEYALAVMDFEGYHNDTPPTNVGEINRSLPLLDNDLVAKKSWFLFDDEVVALGSGINSTKDFDVQTVVENRQLHEVLKPEVPKQTSSSEVVEYEIVKVTATGNDGNIEGNVIDNDYGTRWSLQGTANSFLVLELEDVVPIGYAAIAQYGGTDGRQAIFELEASTDGENWQEVFKGRASGQTELLEAYDMKGVEAKYIRYNGHGRTNSEWNSITEFKLYAPTADGQAPIANLSGSGDGTIYGAEDIIVDGQLLPKENTYKKAYENPGWVNVQNAGGYYFPGGGKLTLEKTDGRSSFIEMWLEHGKKPVNDSYAYAILPNKTAEETAQYAQNPDIEVLMCTEKIHAVKERTTGLLGIVFWEAGSFGNITVSKPMAIMLRETEKGYLLSVSDPSQLLQEAEVTFSQELMVCEKQEGVKTPEELIEQFTQSPCNEYLTVTTKKGVGTTLHFDLSKSPGKTLTAKLKKQ